MRDWLAAPEAGSASTGDPSGVARFVLAEIERDARAADQIAQSTAHGDRFERTLLGRGDRGLVYAVYDDSVQRHVVEKLLHDADPVRLEEARSRLHVVDHPHLVGWLAVRPRDGGGAIARRRSVDGRDIAQEAPSARSYRLLRWFAQIASALATLHSAGVVHGGLCPSNVRVDRSGRVFVVDPGIGGLPEGSPWRAPELGPGGASVSADWYAFGRLMEELAAQVVFGEGPMVALVPRLVRQDARLRPTGPEVLAALVLALSRDLAQGTRYQEMGRIDGGGFGDILRVLDPLAGREVALKRINARGLAAQDAEVRLHNEGRIAAQLQHPSIVPVHEVGFTDDGYPFFTMKLVEGHHLGIAIFGDGEGGGRWPLERLIDAFRRLCEAVAFAHHNGVVHLDLKPRNVMVGTFGEVQLLDWGAARVVGEHSISLDEQVDRLAGTRPYMSPEHEAHELAKIGPPSDVWALGWILFEILTRREPPARGALDEARAQLASAPPELAAIVLHALRPRPDERYPTAAAIVADLEAWRDGREVSVYGYSLLRRLDRRLRPWYPYATAAAVSALVLGGIGWLAMELRRESRAALLEKADAEVERAVNASMDGNHIRSMWRAAGALASSEPSGAELPKARGLIAARVRTPYARHAADCALVDGVITCEGEGDPRHFPPPTPPATVAAPTDVVYDGAPLPVSVAWPCGAARILRAGPDLYLQRADGAVYRLAEGGEDIAPLCDRRAVYVAFRSAERDTEITVWRLDTGPPTEAALLEGHEGRIHAIAWSPDGRWLASAASDATVRLWARERWMALQPAEVSRLPFAADAITFPDDTHLWVQPHALDVWPGTGPRVAPTRSALWVVPSKSSAAVLDNGFEVVSLGWNAQALGTLDRHGTLQEWDATRGFGKTNPTDLGAQAFAPADGADWYAIARGTLTRLGPAYEERWRRPTSAVAVASAGEYVAAAGPDGVVRVDPATGEDRGRWADPADGVAASTTEVAALLSGGGVLVRRWSDGQVTLRDDHADVVALAPNGAWKLLADGPEWRLLDASGLPAGAGRLADDVIIAAFGADGALFALLGRDERIHLFDTASHRELATGPFRVGARPSLAFSPDGQTLALAGGGSEVRLWDLEAARATPDAVLGRIYEMYGAPP